METVVVKKSGKQTEYAAFRCRCTIYSTTLQKERENVWTCHTVAPSLSQFFFFAFLQFLTNKKNKEKQLTASLTYILDNLFQYLWFRNMPLSGSKTSSASGDGDSILLLSGGHISVSPQSRIPFDTKGKRPCSLLSRNLLEIEWPPIIKRATTKKCSDSFGQPCLLKIPLMENNRSLHER